MIVIVDYKDKKEMHERNPNIKNFSVAYTIPRGQGEAKIKAALEKKGLSGFFYRTGSLLWQKKVSFSAPYTPPVKAVR